MDASSDDDVVPSDAGTEPADPGIDPIDAGTEPADAGTEPSDPGGPDAGETPPVTEPPTGVASLGPLPPELSGLRWPEAPRITREVTVSTASALAVEVGVSGTRVRVTGAVGGGITVRANDVEIIADARTSLGTLTIARGVSRVRVTGGSWAAILTTIPAQFYPSVEWRSEWMVTDVLFENVYVNAASMAFEIRGRRIAIVGSRANAVRYSVWCGDTGSMQSEDIILHDNVFISEGPEATVRLVQVLRTATISNTLSNTFKHNYRVHGRSDLAYAAHNLLVGTGVMFGGIDDDIGHLWFDDNVFHQLAPDLFNPNFAIDALHATGNRAYSNVHSCFFCSVVQPGWTISGNTVAPYQPPPAL